MTLKNTNHFKALSNMIFSKVGGLQVTVRCFEKINVLLKSIFLTPLQFMFYVACRHKNFIVLLKICMPYYLLFFPLNESN